MGGASAGTDQHCLLQASAVPKLAAPKNWNAKLVKHDSIDLGIEVDMVSGTVLVVWAVAEGGLFAEWNHAHPGMEIKVGDHIVTVNDQSGDAWAMVHLIMNSTELNLLISRPVSSRLVLS